MIAYPASLKAVGGARSGVAPVNLLDVQDVNGSNYFWSDRKGLFPNGLNLFSSVHTTVPGTAMPWATASGQNADYAFGEDDGTAPIVVVAGLAAGQTLTITATGAVVYFPGPLGLGPSFGPGGDPGYVSGSTTQDGFAFPTLYMQGSKLGVVGLCGAFTDASGNVAGVISIGSGGTFEVPAGASQLQLGINDTHFADNSGSFIATITMESLGVKAAQYQPWLLDVPSFAFHRSLQTDTGSFVVQNLSGNTLSRDAEKILRASTLEGALFVYRLWQADAEAAWLEVHGTLTVEPVGTRDLTLKGSSLINAAQDDTPLEVYCETCQIDWAGRRCGSTQATECQYSFQTCQVIERPMLSMNHFEKNFGEAIANVTTNRQPNRRRKI